MKKLLCLFCLLISSAFAGNDGPSIRGGTDAWKGSGHRFALITDVYDGDTVTVNIQLGYGIMLHDQRLRLYGINTPEVRGPEKQQGLITRDALRDLILHKEVVLDPHNFQKGKYGRWLATIWIQQDDVWINVNQWLIDNNLGKPATY